MKITVNDTEYTVNSNVFGITSKGCFDINTKKKEVLKSLLGHMQPRQRRLCKTDDVNGNAAFYVVNSDSCRVYEKKPE